MSKSSLPQFKKIPPPANLNPEYARIWSGWNELGNKEVAREASAKGFYVNLAIRFIATRKEINSDEAEKWFQDEVLKWFKELLDRKQIHRASHILNNINLDATKELTNIFCETENKELREYIGDHLLKSRKLDPLLKNCWVLLNGIESDEDLFLSLAERQRSLSVSEIVNFDCDLKGNVAVALYFKNYDPELEPFLNAKCLWSFLVTNNKIDLIKLWITVQYSENQLDYGCNSLKPYILDSLIKLFKKHRITETLINSMSEENRNISLETQNIILNELSKYGIFNAVDTNSISHLLKRLKNTGNVMNYKQVLQLETSSMNTQRFYDQLISYCLENNLQGVIVSLFSLNDMDQEILLSLKQNCNSLLILMNSVCDTIVNINDSKGLQRNILRVCNYLNCDVFVFFKTYPIVLVLLTLLDNNLNFVDVVQNSKDTLLLDEMKINLNGLFESLPVLKSVSQKYQNKISINPPTIWKLLARHTDLNTNYLTELIQSTESLPHFNCQNIVELDGYKKTINAIYFLKQCQPSKACRMFFIETSESQEFDKGKIYLKVDSLGIKNFMDVSTSASIIAFLEMLGQSSKPLRIHLEAIKIITNGNSVSDETVEHFLKVKNNPKIIFDGLEKAVMNAVMKFSDIEKDFVKILRTHEILVKFCVLHGLSLPEQLLNLFAINNLWLPFLICAEIYNYPLRQIRLLVQNFKNPHLLEHISHAVLHNIDIDAFMGKRNTRVSLYSKLGVQCNIKKPITFGEEALRASTSSLSSHDSMSSMTSSSDSFDTSDGDILDMKATLLQALLRCHNSADPPKALLQAAQLYRNPLLAVLATSYEPDSVVTSWLVWLGVSCDIYDSGFDYDSMSLCPQSVTQFLKRVAQQKYIKTLLESIEIFLPENPLRYFVTFLNECVRFNFDGDVVKEKMIAFYRRLRYIRSNSIISEMDYEITYLNNKVWIQKVALVLAVTVLEYNFTSRVDQICFIETLYATDAGKILNVPYNFDNLSKILKSIFKFHNEVHLDFSKIYELDEYKLMIQTYLELLVKNCQFEEALSIAEMEAMNKDNILISQFKNFATTQADAAFWLNCNDTFRKHSSVPETVILFFQEFSKTMESVSYEKYIILKLAYQWAVQSSYAKLREIETEMWISYINLHVNDKNRALEAIFGKQSYEEMKQDLESIEEVNICTELNNFNENLDSGISILLNFGHYWDALKIAKMFSYRHADLEILKLCSSVAENLINVENFNKEQRLLLNSETGGFTCRSTSLRSSKVSSTYNEFIGGTSLCTAHEMDPVDHLSKDNLFTLQRLVEKLKSGYTLGRNIFMMYRISINIEIPYVVLLENDDDEKLLKDALDDNCRNKLEVIHDFITVYKWSKVKVTDFICEELINTVTTYIKSKAANFVMWDINVDNEFHLILQLIQENCSLLGMKLFAYSKALHMSQSLQPGELRRISEIAVTVELLIRAHDCFTADCNMEGISIVLKKCQALITLLLQFQSWKLIVRLLTGIRRYTEMEYVFQILRENDQFEFLLNRGSKKDNSLKLALLDYLKKYCPDNSELYRIVALHFTLFSEVAHLWELEADGVIRNLITIAKLEMENNSLNPVTEPFVLFSGTDGTKLCLHKAMMNYSHASQYHLQGEKWSKAMNSAKQAELIALQISRVKNLATDGTTVCLLHLNTLQISELLVKHLSFPQALIVIGAYDYKPDWATILYEQCVRNRHMEYLDQFMNNFILSDHLVQDISRKFLRSTHHPATVNCMKELLQRLPSVVVKYKVASELGFTDILQDLLAEDKLAYLKDTVWKKGYRH